MQMTMDRSPEARPATKSSKLTKSNKSDMSARCVAGPAPLHHQQEEGPPLEQHATCVQRASEERQESDDATTIALRFNIIPNNAFAAPICAGPHCPATG
eukprot:gene44742-42725_t